jgi:hypothetical protein
MLIMNGERYKYKFNLCQPTKGGQCKFTDAYAYLVDNNNVQNCYLLTNNQIPAAEVTG